MADNANAGKDMELTVEGLKTLINDSIKGSLGSIVKDTLNAENEQNFAKFKKEIHDTLDELSKPANKKDVSDGTAVTEYDADEDASFGKATNKTLAKFPKEIHQFKSMGEQLVAIAKSSGDGPARSADPRLLAIEKAASGMGESVPSDGGFLLQPEYTNQIVKRIYAVGELAGLVRKIPIGADKSSLIIPYIDEKSRVDGSRYGAVLAYWANEADTVTKMKAKLGKMTINLEKVMALTYITDELLQDAVALEAYLRPIFEEELQFKVEDAIINGSGAGMPLGVMKAPCLVSVAKETNQTAATLIIQNLVKIYARMWGRSRPDAVWLVNQDIIPQLFTLALAVGTGGLPVFLPAGGVSGAPYATLFGRPIMPSEYCQTLGTQGDVIFGDFGEYVAIEKGQVQSLMSMHVRFLYDEMAYRLTYRFNGQPIWQSALTPKNGTNTLSPFVVCDTRS